MRVKAAVARAHGAPLAIEDLDLDEPRAGEILVRVIASGVAACDRAAIDGDLAMPLPFVPGCEGAGIVVLEELEHAKARGAKVYAEVSGYGMSGDAHHITAPAEGHEGAFRAMTAALRNGGLQPGDIHYINAHGTSTPMGDDLELEAVEQFFGDHARHVAMSSTKSATGHLLGAAGAIEAIFSLLAIRDSVVPPTLNLDVPSRDSVVDRVAHAAQERRIDVALSNSFGFGGTNASILFRRV